MATGLERPPWDTSKADGNHLAPADGENRDWMRQALAGGGAGNPDSVLAELIGKLPTSWEDLPPGALWNNGGIITRVES